MDILVNRNFILDPSNTRYILLYIMYIIHTYAQQIYMDFFVTPRSLRTYDILYSFRQTLHPLTGICITHLQAFTWNQERQLASRPFTFQTCQIRITKKEACVVVPQSIPACARSHSHIFNHLHIFWRNHLPQ